MDETAKEWSQMKVRKFPLLAIAVVCLAGLLLAGFTRARDRYSVSQLRERPLTLPVPLVQQSNGTSCGEAVMTMAYNYAYPGRPLSEPQIIKYAADSGSYFEDLSPFTSPENMVKIARHYADNVSTGWVFTAGAGLSLLIQRLRNDEPVLIDVLSDFYDPSSVAHFIVVTGITVDPSRGDAVVIHYNDPLTGTRRSADWKGSRGLWNAWQTNNDPGGPGWWLVISPP